MLHPQILGWIAKYVTPFAHGIADYAGRHWQPILHWPNATALFGSGILSSTGVHVLR